MSTINQRAAFSKASKGGYKKPSTKKPTKKGGKKKGY